MPIKKVKYINLAGFAFALATVIFLLLYQVFVFANFTPVGVRRFFAPKFFASALPQLTNHAYLPPVTPLPEPNLSLEVACSDFCHFLVLNANDRSLVKDVPAIVDVDAAARLKKLSLNFFDPVHGLIGYQSLADSPKFYVINFTPDLLQAIELKINQQIDFEFIDYFYATKQILFKSINSATGQTDYFLYSADRPELHLLNQKDLSKLL